MTTDYQRLILQILRELGIPETYGPDRQLGLQRETANVVPVGLDLFNREQRLAPPAAEAWSRLREVASQDGVVLQLVSGFRSVEYQRRLIENKKARGIPLHEILRSSAAPGYSEHHTGLAVDISTPGFSPLEGEFEHSIAFAWLSQNAPRLGFRMSFPRDNPHGIVYEPWHWKYESVSDTPAPVTPVIS